MLTPARVLAVACLVTAPDGRVLLVRRAKPPNEGKLSLPGGRVEHGEGLEAAAHRELLEETGLIAQGRAREVAVVEEGRYTIYVLDLGSATAKWGTPAAGSDALEARFVDVRSLTESEVSAGLLALLALIARFAAVTATGTR